MAMVVDSGVGGECGLFVCVTSGFELEFELGIGEWRRCLVLSMSLSQIRV